MDFFVFTVDQARSPIEPALRFLVCAQPRFRAHWAFFLRLGDSLILCPEQWLRAFGILVIKHYELSFVPAAQS